MKKGENRAATDCHINPGCACVDKDCEHCGFNPVVEKKRIAEIAARMCRKSVRTSSKMRIKSRVLDGLVGGGNRLELAKIELEVRQDKKGKSLALSADEYGIMLMIPLETVGDMIQVRG